MTTEIRRMRSLSGAERARKRRFNKKQLKTKQTSLTESRTPRALERLEQLREEINLYKATMRYVMSLGKDQKWQEAYALFLWRYFDARLGQHLWFLTFDLEKLHEFSDAPPLEDFNMEALEKFVKVRARWAYKRALEDLVECALTIKDYEVRRW